MSKITTAFEIEKAYAAACVSYHACMMAYEAACTAYAVQDTPTTAHNKTRTALALAAARVARRMAHIVLETCEVAA